MIFLKKYNSLICFLFSCVLYFFVAHFLERTAFSILVFCWGSLFTCFYFFIQKTKLSDKSLFSISIIFRLLFLLAIPNLSQDFYRFIWDGRMLFEGLNPYISLPENYITHGISPINQAETLYKGMGVLNGSHYTNYPPINQLCFLLAAMLANNSIIGAVIVMRILIILADVGIIIIGKKLLTKLNLPTKNIYLYALNPFVIIELTGNLHFEPVMLFFFIASMYFLYKERWIVAAILLALSVSVKLIPLFFLPLFFQWFIKRNKQLNIYKLIAFYSIAIGVTLLLFIPFYTEELINNYSNSVGLWFRNFEFNASFYYIFREIGYWFRGYNEIAIIGKILPIISVSILLVFTFLKDNTSIIKLFTSMLLSLSCYYFMSTTVHPWYLATPIIICVFTKYRFPIIWSLVIILSYEAYANTPWKENLLLVTVEYTIVFGFLIWESIKKTKPI